MLENENINELQKPQLNIGAVRRSYSQMVDDFLKEMLQKSPFNSVEWVRFRNQQLDDFIYYSQEYTAISGGNDYIFRSEKYNIKSSISGLTHNNSLIIIGSMNTGVHDTMIPFCTDFISKSCTNK